MKNIKMFLGMLATLLLIVGASVTASAGAIGDSVMLGGFQIGWWLIGIAIVLGLFAFMGVFSKAKIGTPAIALLLIGAVLLIPIDGPAVTPPGSIVTGGATFDIEMANGTYNVAGDADITATADADAKGVTYQLNQDGTHTLDEFYGAANFTLNPVAPDGATNDDLVTISWVFNDEATYDGDDIFDETANVPDVDFWVNGVSAATAEKAVEGGSGSHTMLYTDTDFINMAFEVTSGAADTFAHNMDTVGETYTLPITFSCGDWSETLTFTFVVITNA